MDNLLGLGVELLNFVLHVSRDLIEPGSLLNLYFSVNSSLLPSLSVMEPRDLGNSSPRVRRFMHENTAAPFPCQCSTQG